LFNEILKKGFGMSLLSDGADFFRDTIRSDVGLNYFLSPIFRINGLGIDSDKALAYSSQRKTSGAGSTSFPDHLKPVMTSPLTKDNRPWIAGLKGVRKYDVSQSNLGLSHALWKMGWDEFEIGAASTRRDIRLGVDATMRAWSLSWRNFINGL
jgi:hypothetical protein